MSLLSLSRMMSLKSRGLQRWRNSVVVTARDGRDDRDRIRRAALCEPEVEPVPLPDLD